MIRIMWHTDAAELFLFSFHVVTNGQNLNTLTLRRISFIYNILVLPLSKISNTFSENIYDIKYSHHYNPQIFY